MVKLLFILEKNVKKYLSERDANGDSLYYCLTWADYKIPWSSNQSAGFDRDHIKSRQRLGSVYSSCWGFRFPIAKISTTCMFMSSEESDWNRQDGVILDSNSNLINNLSFSKTLSAKKPPTSRWWSDSDTSGNLHEPALTGFGSLPRDLLLVK